MNNGNSVVASTPERLRLMAADVENYAADMHLVSAWLRVAADELDRLQARCEFFDGEHAQVKANRDHVIAEYQRLRKVTRDAPHHQRCDLVDSHGPCTCWKADAL